MYPRPYYELPDDIIFEIFEFIPRNLLSRLSKFYYDQHKMQLQTRIRKNTKKYKYYLIKLLKHDDHQQFQQHLKDDGHRWMTMRPWYDCFMEYSSFFQYIYYIAHQMKAEQCKQLLFEFMLS